jgi:DNA-binding transcriptional ArsR family regulator
MEESSEESVDRGGKRRKLTDEERLKRCRERNKLHARNTRQKKKYQIEALHKRIEQLTDEKIRLINEKSEKSVASILMALADGNGTTNGENKEDIDKFSNRISNAREETMKILGRIRSQVSSLLVEESEFDKEISPKLPRDRSLCTASEIDKLRRERNRLHAKKTRLRKKKMLQEMETIVKSLQEDISILKQEKLISITSRDFNSMNPSVVDKKKLDQSYEQSEVKSNEHEHVSEKV